MGEDQVSIIKARSMFSETQKLVDALAAKNSISSKEAWEKLAKAADIYSFLDEDEQAKIKDDGEVLEILKIKSEKDGANFDLDQLKDKIIQASKTLQNLD